MNIPVYIRRRFGLVATVIACAVSAPVLASESVHLDKFPTEKMQSMPALQDRARPLQQAETAPPPGRPTPPVS